MQCSFIQQELLFVPNVLLAQGDESDDDGNRMITQDTALPRNVAYHPNTNANLNTFDFFMVLMRFSADYLRFACDNC